MLIGVESRCLEAVCCVEWVLDFRSLDTMLIAVCTSHTRSHKRPDAFTTMPTTCQSGVQTHFVASPRPTLPLCPHYTEPELSAQLQGLELAGELISSTIAPYVPATTMKTDMTKMDKLTAAMMTLRSPGALNRQLSCHHMMGKKETTPCGENSAPMKLMIAPKDGIAEARMYAVPDTPSVQPSQVAQCLNVLFVKCSVPWRRRTKMSLAESCGVSLCW